MKIIRFVSVTLLAVASEVGMAIGTADWPDPPEREDSLTYIGIVILAMLLVFFVKRMLTKK